MRAHNFSTGVMTLATLVLVGGTACEQADDGIGSEQSAIEEEGPQGHLGRGMKRGMGHGPGRFMADLDLTEEQQASIEALHNSADTELASSREQMKALRTDLDELWQAEQPDADAILAKMAQIDALQGSARERGRALKQSIDEVLTSEQREQLTKRRADGMGQGRRGRRGGGPGAGGPGAGGPGFGRGGRGHGMGGPGMGGPGFGRGGRGHGMGGPGMGGPGFGMGGPGGRGVAALDQLDLSEDQEAQIEALRAQALEATSDARAQLDEARQAMRAARTDGNDDDATFEAIRARTDAARDVVREQMVRTRVAILGILTAEQRAELQSIQAEHRQHRGRRGPRGDGAGFRGGNLEQGQGFGPGHGRGMHRGRGFGRGPGPNADLAE